MAKETKNDEINKISETEKAKYEKMFEEMFAKAREKAEAEAAKIIEEAKNQTTKKNKKVNPKGEELMSYTFFKDDGEYSDDVYISVNGERIVCQRGVPVKIKRKFVWAYELAEAQKRKAANMVSVNETRYKQRVKEVGF